MKIYSNLKMAVQIGTQWHSIIHHKNSILNL